MSEHALVLPADGKKRDATVQVLRNDEKEVAAWGEWNAVALGLERPEDTREIKVVVQMHGGQILTLFLDTEDPIEAYTEDIALALAPDAAKEAH